jgi:hypothetical protein
VRGPLPLLSDQISGEQQIQELSTYAVVDDLVLPEGFTYDIIGLWGDKVGDSRFGYNNDYLSFVPTSDTEGFLSINFEYINAVWLQTFEAVIGKKLPVEAVMQAIGKTGINVADLSSANPLKQQVQSIGREALIDQGIGIISLRKTSEGKWERTFSAVDRRITGLSGWQDGRYLACTGPAQAVFRKTTGQGYLDGLGEKIIGTFANCAGGTTPWGTVLSAEENFQSQVPEAVYADGTAFAPSQQLFTITSGQGNPFGLAGNKYGWIVEVDPANPQDWGTKHTWLGRYRHEAVGVRVEAGKPLAFYSGCDRCGGHLYKFVSQDSVVNPQDKANSKLLAQGMLYAAQFHADGRGQWIPLNPDTPVNPVLPSTVVGEMITLPQRPEGGAVPVRSDREVKAFQQRYKTLADLYRGNPTEQQGAILIDAHAAANACGATCTARPEDTEVAPDGSLYITFTSGGASDTDGSPDRRIFKGPQGETPYEYGFIMHLTEDQNDPAALTFRWTMLALGGEPSRGGAGFSNPDNVLIDPQGNVWMVTDMSSDTINSPGKDLRGQVGNNAIWFIPTSGDNAGTAYRFAMGPMECELTGPFLTSDQQTLFLSVQHPGEANGTRQDGKSQTRTFTLKTTTGESFQQTRQVPIGSNFPSKQSNDPPKPTVVAIRRISGTITSV